MATQDGGTALERDRFVRWARVIWVDRALGQLLDQDHEARFAGDFRRGVFSESNGQGDTEAIAWNESGLMALSFIHDEPGTGIGGDRLATSEWVTFGPPELADLAARWSGI